MSERMRGYHFVREDRTLCDGQKLRVGKVYRLPPGAQPALRKHGYHASADVLDALGYAPGPILCRVELRGAIVHGSNKAVATKCKVLSARDVTRELHEFAVWCAERALKGERKAGRELDPRSWAALKVRRAWLDGRATDAELKEAYRAARFAAVSARDSPARFAAVAAAHATGSSAASSVAAWVRSAAYWAARSVSVPAERRAQSRKLQRLVAADMDRAGRTADPSQESHSCQPGQVRSDVEGSHRSFRRSRADCAGRADPRAALSCRSRNGIGPRPGSRGRAERAGVSAAGT